MALISGCFPLLSSAVRRIRGPIAKLSCTSTMKAMLTKVLTTASSAPIA